MGALSSRPLPLVGLSLHADAEFLAVVEPLLAHIDYGEVAPETLWRLDHRGLRANRYHERFLQLRAELQLPFVAHGVGGSPGTVPLPNDADADSARCVSWQAQLHSDHRQFEFLWCSDHLGATVVGGEHAVLPLPLPMAGRSGAAMADHVRERMLSMFGFVAESGGAAEPKNEAPKKEAPGEAREPPRIAIENSAFYFALASPGARADAAARTLPMAEPAFLNRCVADPRLGLLLDLHNLHCAEQNFGVDALAWLDELAFDKVIEIHVAGGTESDPAWRLPGDQTLRLDSHDQAVPERVWELLDAVLPRCPQLRGITLERMEGTVSPEDVGVLHAELDRIRAALDGGWRRPARPHNPPRVARANLRAQSNTHDAKHFSAELLAACAHQQRTLAAALRATDPQAAWLASGEAPVEAAGLVLTSSLVARLRFERILRGSDALRVLFDEEPELLVEQFRDYHRAEAPGLLDAPAEARAFLAWRSAHGSR